MFEQVCHFFIKINRKFLADYFIVLLLALVLFSWLQASPTLPEPDSFYHAKIASILSEGRILQEFPWLQETNFKDNFVDHHFLYHLLLVPFVKIFNPLVGIKVATALFASLAILLIYWLFKKFQVKWPFLFILALLSSEPWLFRASLVKAPVVLLSFTVLSFYFLAHYKYKLLALVSFLSVWLYAGWPLLAALAILYALVVWLLERIKQEDSIWFRVKGLLKIKKNQIIPWTGVCYCLAGMVLGLVINPYFPKNLNFYWQQIVQIALVNQQSSIGVGGEWYPYGFLKLVSDAPLVCALLAVSILLFVLSLKKQSVYSWTWSILAIAFFVLTLKSRRNVEFFIPLTVIFSAFCFSDYFKKFHFSKIVKKCVQTILGGVFAVILLGFIFLIPKDILAVKKDMRSGWPISHYQKASNWLWQNSLAGAIVFNSDWDDWPFLFYYNSHNYYLTGLDPTFMYQKNSERYQKYVDVTLGKSQFELKQIIKDEFKAGYVFLDTKHKAFEDKLKYSPDFLKVYSDDEAVIYKINIAL